MLIFENISLALSALSANKMRAFLTMLGIMIGISSVIAVMTVGDGMSNSMLSSMDELGANKVEFYLTTKGMGDESEEGDIEAPVREKKPSDYLSGEIIDQIQIRFSDKIKSISLKQEVGMGTYQTGRQKYNFRIIGYNDGALEEKKLQMTAGNIFTEKEQEENRRVVLVADKVAKVIWGHKPEAALGKTLEISLDGKFYSYTVIGVYQYRQSDFGNVQVSDRTLTTEAYIPLNTALMQSHAEGKYESFTVRASTSEAAISLGDEIKEYVNDNYYASNDTYKIDGYNMASMQKEMGSMMNTIKLAIAGIAAISLLVGGVGVMNIMIVSITERTREIGTRKALGATNASIRVQFVVEAVVICVIGGSIGVALGIGFGIGITKVMGYQGLPSVSVIIGAVLFSVVFGLFFGYYPANKAAKMNPIEALRYE